MMKQVCSSSAELEQEKAELSYSLRHFKSWASEVGEQAKQGGSSKSSGACASQL